jgi:tetratricopeptide (TPR) repeat protein
MSETHSNATGRRALTELWRVEFMRGLAHLQRGDAAGAEACFARAHRAAPERAEACFALGRERLRQERLDEAEALLGQAWSGGLVAAAAALARCLAAAGRRAEAHGVLEGALAAHADEAGLLTVRAEILLDEDRIDEAHAALERAARALDKEERDAPATRRALATLSARCLNAAGIRHAAAGEEEAALFAFKRAFDLAPGWASPLVNMGAAFARLGRAARARASYERALVLDADNAVARYNLATLLAARGERARAEAELRRVLALDAAYPGAREALEALLDPL